MCIRDSGEYNTVKLGFTVGILKAHRQIGFHLFYRKLGGKDVYKRQISDSASKTALFCALVGENGRR